MEFSNPTCEYVHQDGVDLVYLASVIVLSLLEENCIIMLCRLDEILGGIFSSSKFNVANS